MSYLILVITLLIFAETTTLLFKKQPKIRPKSSKIYIDTSALIDGRILEIAKTNFIKDDIIILSSVLHELQLLADGRESTKRGIARFGLEVATKLEELEEISVQIEDDTTETKFLKVDDELLKYAKKSNAKILTLDYNLIKIANAEGIETLNINDLSLAVRRIFHPGEEVSVKILEKGSNKNQGIAYLDDGTMVVVKNGAGKIGETVDIELLRLRETSAGRMVFARFANPKKK